MHLSHARTLCHARSALAMLADTATSIEASSAYEHVLITLDAIHGNDGPAIATRGLPADRDGLVGFAAATLLALTTHGVDELHVELLLAMLHDAAALDLTVMGDQ